LILKKKLKKLGLRSIFFILIVTISLTVYFLTSDMKLRNIGFQNNQPQYIVPFSLEDLNGNMRDISEWSEQKILINFWATWCAPCRREMPMFQTLHLNQEKHGMQIIGIAVDQNELVRDFINEYGISFPILIGQSSAYEIMKDLGNTSLTLPYTLLVEPGGLITWYKNGEVTSQDLPVILGD
jgi:thiol-disulfide isomerase/thioredoxin